MKYVILLTLIIGVYAFLSVPDVFEWYDFADRTNVIERIDDLKLDKFDVYLKYLILKPGVDLGFPKLIPFFESVILLVIVYFLAVKLSNQKFAGLLSVVIVASSSLFYWYDTSLPYDNSWIIFLLLAIYFEKSKFSPVFFIASIFCKPITVLFIPFMIFLSLRNKRLGIAYIAIGAVSIFGISTYYDGFVPSEFVEGFYDNMFWLSADMYVLIMIPFVMAGLIVARKYGYQNTMIPFAFIINALITSSVIEGFTGMWNQGYRYIPLIIFFAIGVAILLQSKKPKLTSEVINN